MKTHESDKTTKELFIYVRALSYLDQAFNPYFTKIVNIFIIVASKYVMGNLLRYDTFSDALIVNRHVVNHVFRQNHSQM